MPLFDTPWMTQVLFQTLDTSFSSEASFKPYSGLISSIWVKHRVAVLFRIHAMCYNRVFFFFTKIFPRKVIDKLMFIIIFFFVFSAVILDVTPYNRLDFHVIIVFFSINTLTDSVHTHYHTKNPKKRHNVAVLNTCSNLFKYKIRRLWLCFIFAASRGAC